MHEWLEGLQKSAKRTAAGAETEELRRAETESGVPFPDELGELYRRFNGGEFQGDVTLFPLHGPEGAPSVMEKSRLKLESLPAAGVWRIGVKGAHRQLFTARKSAMLEQADSPLPGWAEKLSDDDWLYGTWETEARELRMYRSLRDMLEVLVPPAEVEEFGDRTYARALSAVQGALSDLSVEYEEGAAPPRDTEEGEEEEAEDGESRADGASANGGELRQLVVAAAERRVNQLRQTASEDVVARATGAAIEVVEGTQRAAKKAASAVKDAAKTVVVQTARTVADSMSATTNGGEEAPAATQTPAPKTPARKAVSAVKDAAKTVVVQAARTVADSVAATTKVADAAPAAAKTPNRGAPAKKAAAAKKAPAKKAAAKKAPAKKAAAAKKAPAKKAAAAKKAPTKKAPAKKAAAAKKAPAKKAAAAKKAPAKKAPAKKAAGSRTASKRGAAGARR